MRSIPPRHRSAVARRIAAGLPLWAAARGSAIPAEQVSTLMGEPDFRELISAWTDIFELDDEACDRRLLTLASMIIEERLEKGCWRTAHFVQHRCARRQKPREVLAKGFAQLVDMEKARVERFGRPAGSRPASPPPPTPVHAAVAEAEAARRLRAKPDEGRQMVCHHGTNGLQRCGITRDYAGFRGTDFAPIRRPIALAA